MTRIVASVAFDMYELLTEGSLADFFEFADVVTKTSTTLVLRDSYDGIVEQLTLTGSFGGYNGGDYPTTGTVTGGSYGLNGTLFSFSGASISVTDFTDYVLSSDLVGLFQQLLDGADQLIGSSANDVLYGFDGNDSMDGRGGNDALIGGFGNDSYYINSAYDAVYENSGQGIDIIYSSTTVAMLPDEVENLTYTGTSSFRGTGNYLNNVIRGAGGADQLNGGLGADFMYGGNGNDLYTVDNAGDRAVEAAATGGIDTVNSSVTFRLGNYVERLTLTGTAAINGTGNDIANLMFGNSGNNILDGRGGADSMRGGAGNDIYYVDNAADAVVEASGAGLDQVRSTVSFTLSSNVERLLLTGVAAVNGTGNGIDNVLTGNGAANVLSGLAGSDSLIGGAGNDTLLGGLGNDYLRGGTGADKFQFDSALSASGNVDRIYDFSVADDTVVLDQTVFSAVAALGTLTAAAFYTGAAAHDADDRIIYDAASGRLYYDADGNGAGAQVLFATANAGLALTHSDFLIVA